MKTSPRTLTQKIQSRRARVGVIGLGYVGLPLAVEFAKEGYRVTGIDVAADKVKMINAGKCYIPDIPAKELEDLVSAGVLNATSDFSVLKQLDAVMICVPTPLRKTRDPDISFIVSASEALAKNLHRYQVITLESTTYPGTTEEVILPMLEATGLKVGKDFFLGFSPERIDPGNESFNTRSIPKVVSGVTPECRDMIKLLYGQVIAKVIPVSSTRVAEMVKLLENTFRAVNIGMVNELALMCDRMGVDVWEVIEAAKSKPFGFMPFYPGPGLGGHCIPIDPLYLSWKARETGFESRFIELASHVNGSMPEHVIQRISRILNDRGKSIKGADILVLGAAYKKNVGDCRESPAVEVMQHLAKEGAKVAYHDPYVSNFQLNGHRANSTALSPQRVARADCVVLLTDHDKLDYNMVARHAKILFDTRNALPRFRVTGKNVIRL